MQPIPPQPWYRNDRWLLVGLLLVGTGLRLFQLERDSLWVDEIAQVLIVQNRSLWQAILNTAHNTGGTPLDYIITNLTVSYIGQSEGILRLPALIWGVLAIAVIYQLGTYLFNKPTGLLAACFLTIMPLEIQYSREVRFYSLPTLLILLNLYVLVQALDKNTRRWWLLYGFVLLVALYSHFYVAIVLALQSVWILLVRRPSRSALTGYIIAAGCAAVLFAPWAVYYQVNHIPIFSLNPQPSAADVLSAPFFDTTPGFAAVRQANPQVQIATILAYWNVIRWTVGLYGTLLLIGLYMLVRKRTRRQFKVNLFLLLFLALGGIAAAVVVDFISHYFFVARQVIFFSPALLLAISAIWIYMFEGVRKPAFSINKPLLIYGSVIVLALVSLAILWRPITDLYKPSKQDWRGLARYLLQHVGPDDAFISPYASFVAFYAPELMAYAPASLPDTPADMERILQTHKHVWFMLEPAEITVRPPFLVGWISQQGLTDLSVGPDFQVYVQQDSYLF